MIVKEEDITFRRITVDMKDRFESTRHEYGNDLYSHTFNILFLWQKDMQMTADLREDGFLVKCAYRGDNAYLFPCGSVSRKKFYIDWLTEKGDFTFYYLTEEDAAFLESNYPGRFAVEDFRDDYSYLYGRESHIELAGHSFRKIRNSVNYGLSLFDWKIEKIDAANIERVKTVVREWDKNYSSVIKTDIDECMLALDNYDKLGMYGFLFSDGLEDFAAAYGSFTSEKIFDLNVCKTLLDDIDSYVKWEFYKRLPEQVEYVDAEDDMGIDGLRRHKLSRLPDILLPVKKAEFHADVQ